MQITLSAARKNKGLKQKEAAKILGITEYTLSNYERGITAPDVHIVKKIEELYGISYNDLNFLPKNNG